MTDPDSNFILDLPERRVISRPFAGFRKRAGAFIIDLTLLYLAHLAFRDLVDGMIATSFTFKVFGLVFTTPYFILSIPYFTLMESSRFQATLGKMVVGLKVGSRTGERITLMNAFGRCFASYLSGILLFFGYLMVIWTARKQALHDLLADTYVFAQPPNGDAGVA